MKLLITYQEELIGTLDEKGKFSYDPNWNKFDLCFAMPRNEKFSQDHVKAYFSNMVIEGDLKDLIAKQKQFDRDDFVSFLKVFGQDCAGALVIRPDDLTILDQDPKRLMWSDLDKRMEERVPLIAMEESHFSLAGAQDKLPVIIDSEGLEFPTLSRPSTHILKPLSNWNGVRESVANEWFCMRLAEEIGLPVPKVSIHQSKFPYYIAERYDRADGVRLHQQDFCQALGLMSFRKYESKGGPSLAKIYQTIQSHSQNKFLDLQMFLRWLCFNLLIGNHDSHAKNISFLLSNGKWSLAPFYDLMSTAVYPEFTNKFAFSIAGQNDPLKLKASHFSRLDEELKVRSGTLQTVLSEVTENLALALSVVVLEAEDLGLDRFIVGKISNHIQKVTTVFDQRVFIS